jgi:hydrogenase nickel incorporation protein HypA/HybF
MHEYSIAQDIATILSSVGKEHGRRVLGGTVAVGPLSMIVPELLHEAWAAVTLQTPLEGSALTIEQVPIRARCTDCGHETESFTPFIKCEQCGSLRLKMASGHELAVLSAELADPEEEPDAS